jgi:hypothetical protein
LTKELLLTLHSKMPVLEYSSAFVILFNFRTNAELLDPDRYRDYPGTSRSASATRDVVGNAELQHFKISLNEVNILLLGILCIQFESIARERFVEVYNNHEFPATLKSQHYQRTYAPESKQNSPIA